MIPRTQIIGRLRDENFSHSGHGKRTEILRQHGTGIYVGVPFRKSYTPQEAATILKQAKLSKEQIEHFLADCLKD